MDYWTYSNSYTGFDALIVEQTRTYHAWRKPTDEEQAKSPAGHVVLDVRDETRRAVCQAWEFDAARRLLWAVWRCEQRENEESPWHEVARRPCLTEFGTNAKGYLGYRELPITAASNEWRYLCPPAVREQL